MGTNYVRNLNAATSITLAGERRTNWPSGGSITETDPVFSASSAAGIGAGDIGNWNTAFGWGNWATDVAYLAALTNATMTESTVNGVAINGRTLAITVRTNYAGGGGDASGWSGFAATQNVNMAGFSVTNANSLAVTNSITLGGETRTNWPTGGGDSFGLYRYYARTNEGETVEVFASGTNVTANRTGSTFNMTIPQGTRILSMKIRVNGSYLTAGAFYLSMGTNDVNNSGVTTAWCPTIKCFREDTFANIGATVSIYSSDPTLITLTGLNSTAGIINNCRLNF